MSTMTAKLLYAHRVAYAVGPIPEGLVLDHLCRNRRCVNPAQPSQLLRARNAASDLPGARTLAPQKMAGA
jgi:hypothetical protein